MRTGHVCMTLKCCANTVTDVQSAANSAVIIDAHPPHTHTQSEFVFRFYKLVYVIGACLDLLSDLFIPSNVSVIQFYTAHCVKSLRGQLDDGWPIQSTGI